MNKEYRERSAFEYAENLKEPWRSDPIVRGIIEEAFIAGMSSPIKTARVICSADTGWNPQCSECQKTIEGSDIELGEFCRCGSKIIE